MKIRWVSAFWAAVLCLCCLPCLHSEAEEEYTMTSPAIETLRNWGFSLDDEILREAEMQLKPGTDIRELDTASLLFLLGLGKYDNLTDEWEPFSHDVYIIDAEVVSIDRMYTNILTGIAAIVPDIRITGVEEDLSGMTVEMVPNEIGRLTDGKRTVSFQCNGHPYSIELVSYGDWVNEEFFSFMDQVLEQEHCPHQLIQMTVYGQYVAMVYGPYELAERIYSILGPF